MNTQKVILNLLLAGVVGCLAQQAAAAVKARNDSYTINEDATNVVLNVLANDDYTAPAIINKAGKTMTIDGVKYKRSTLSTPTTIVDAAGIPITLPNGRLTLNANGTITYHPKPNFNGTDSFQYTFKDKKNKKKKAKVTITVRSINDAPVVTGQSHTIDEGQVLSVTAIDGLLSTAYDVEAQPLSLIIASQPANGALTVDLSSGSYEYTPTSGFSGTDSFTFSVFDGTDLNVGGPQRVDIQVLAITPPINAVNDSYTIDEDAGSVVLAVLSNDLLNGLPVQISAAGIVATVNGDQYPDSSESTPTTMTDAMGVSLTSPNGRVSVSGNSVLYQPKANFNGADFFHYTIDDGLGHTSEARVEIYVRPINDPPTLTGAVYSTIVNVDFALDAPGLLVLAYDVDGDLLEAYERDDAPNGKVLIRKDGSFFYRPENDFIGTDTFSFYVKDNDGWNVGGPQTVTIHVQAAPPPPTQAVDDSYTVTEDAGDVELDVMANDLFDPVAVTIAGVTVTIAGQAFPASTHTVPTSVSDPLTGDTITLPNGTLDILPSGVILYRPKDNYNGTDFFTYTIEDALGRTDEGRVDLIITAVNDAPTVSDMNYTMLINEILTVVTPGLLHSASDPDGQALTVTKLSDPENGTLTLEANGRFVYTPTLDYIGFDSFTFEVSDGIVTDEGGPRTVTILVDEVPSPPPPPPGVVTVDLPLAEAPLELGVGVDPSVLILMDDSGSMVWTVLTTTESGRMELTNENYGSGGSDLSIYSYVFPVSNNVFDSKDSRGRLLPSQESIEPNPNANTDFRGNRFGVWRGRNHQYNKLYYNPAKVYQPWVGFSPDSNDRWPDATPGAAANNPWVLDEGYTNLLTEKSWSASENVPNKNGKVTDIDVDKYWIPRYYTITDNSCGVDCEPAWDTGHQLVEIRSNKKFYAKAPTRTDCIIKNNQCTYDEEIQNFANWFTYYRSREHAMKASIGSVVSETSGMKIGYAAFNDENDRLREAKMNASAMIGNKRALMDMIYRISSLGTTPSREALWKAGRYYECQSGDIFGSEDSSLPGAANCSMPAVPDGGACQQNFALLVTDGAWAVDDLDELEGIDALDNNDGDENTDFDGGMFKDANLQSLSDIAMHYYERDLAPELPNAVPTTSRDRAMAPASALNSRGSRMQQHMKTFPIGFGITGSVDEADLPVSYQDPMVWPDVYETASARVDDLLHASLSGRGEYLSAASASGLDAALSAAFDEIAAYAGTASAASFNSQQLQQDTLVFRGFYNAQESVGDLVAQRINLDTGQLISPPFWSAADGLASRTPATRKFFTWNDETATGIPFQNALEEGSAVHRASFATDATADITTRVAYLKGDRSAEPFLRARSSTGLLGDIVNSTPVFVGVPAFQFREQGNYPALGDDTYSVFQNNESNRDGAVYVGANDGMLHAFSADTGSELFAYIPNKLINGSAYANPLPALLSPDYSHKFFVDNTPAINDIFYDPGFDAVNTREWRSVLVGSLRAGGKGIYALDITDPTGFSADKVIWEFDDNDDTYPTNADGTLVGDGLLLDPLNMPVKDLGYTYSVPTITMTTIDPTYGSGIGGAFKVSDPITMQEKKWAAIFGNGYNSTYGVAKLFALFIEDGADGRWDDGDVIKIDTGYGSQATGPNAGLPNGLGTPRVIDFDGDGSADFAYAGDLLGNLFRFDLRDPDPANWKSTRIYKATYPDGSAIGQEQPITSQPIVTLNPDGDGVVVIFTTGSYFTTADATSSGIQSIYGVWDRFESSPETGRCNAADADGVIAKCRDLLVEQEITNVYDQSLGALRTLTNKPVIYSIDKTVTERKRGWVIDLDPPRPALTIGTLNSDGTRDAGVSNPDTAGDAPPAPQFPGERAVRNLQLLGGFLFVNTVIPRDAVSCSEGPGGFSLAFNPLTGGAGGESQEQAFDINGDDQFSDEDKVDYEINNGGPVGGDVVIGMRYDDAIPTDSAFLGNKRVTQLSDQSIDIQNTNTDSNDYVGRLSWKRL
ncbi:MAG: type IV pilus assembly protein PilY1 [Candidatus Paceibacteria bacterium]|jgi:type IV pilus assembly protein PilY1